MRLLLIGIALVACTASERRSDSDTTLATKTIFRQIDVAPFGAVVLGASLADATSAPMIEVQPHMFLLLPEGGRFADTDSLFVLVTETGRVSGMRFVYDRAKNFDAAVAEYTRALGAATTRASFDSAGAQVTRVVWTDAKTGFALTRATFADGSAQVSSLLRDRARLDQ